MKRTKNQMLEDQSENETLLPINKTALRMTSETVRDSLRPEIQGLRAIAICAVLLFHMWSKTFPVGYLGVDCFFVISGYLMIMLLSRKQTLTSADSVNFYYRRIKRIVPIYVFVVSVTLIACYYLISKYDYGSIVMESVPSLFFYSNFPFVHKTEYFDIKSKYQFFLHTWSLSCELQFYLFVPLLILIINKLTNKHFFLTLLFIFTLSIASFCRQVFSTSNAKHMTLDGRTWQFMFGFLAHFVYKSKFIDWAIKSEQNICCKLLCWIRNLTPIALLVWLLTFPVIDLMERQIQRALVVFLTVLIISIRQDSSVLGGDTLVNLGDVSYSVYLVHWPIFTMHRYLDPEVYEDGVDANHMVGSYLIGISILFGFFVEKNFKRILVLVKNWSHLFKLLFLLYLTAGVSLYYLHKDAYSFIDAQEAAKSEVEKRFQSAVILWESRDSAKYFTNFETIKLNTQIGYVYPICRNNTRYLPSSFKDWSSFDTICTERGTGNKTVFVFGNSHAYLTFAGLAHVFKPIAKEIIVVGNPACVPGLIQHQHHKLAQAKKLRCLKFLTDILKTIQQYHKKPDIIVPLYGWFDFKEFSKPESAKLQNRIQELFNGLSDAVNEVVFAPRMNLVFSRNKLVELQDKLWKNEIVNKLGETKKRILSVQPSIRHVLNSIKCPKCIKINWLDLWCDNDYCSSIDRKRMSYFMDEHHPTLYGSIVIGNYLLKAYEQVER